MKKLIEKIDNKLKIDIDRLPHENGIDHLPNRLWPFIWFFVRQAKIPIIGITVTEGYSRH